MVRLWEMNLEVLNYRRSVKEVFDETKPLDLRKVKRLSMELLSSELMERLAPYNRFRSNMLR